MSENDSQRPQDVGNAGETQQQPRVQVESTPADGNNIPYVQAYDTQTGKPLGGQQVVNKHTVVKTKTKKLPIFITALAGCACGALLVIALIMSGTLDIGGGKNAVTAGASGSSTQKITIDSEDTTLAEAVSAKALPSVVSITATSSGGQNGSLSQSADESDNSGSVGSGVVLDTEGHILTNNHVVDGYDQYVVTMDDGTTVSHLTYIGDSDVGKGCNFGCGTVTSNYDGQGKYRCTIGDYAFIGCNTNLIAPVKVGDGAYTAAGSTITGDVPAGALGIARERQSNKEGWAEPRLAAYVKKQQKKMADAKAADEAANGEKG